MASSTAPDGPREVPPIHDPIVSKWQRLASMDRQSPDFLPLLSTLTTGDSRSSTINLQDENARIVLGALDEFFRDGRIPNEYEFDTRKVMRKLAYDSCQVPPRYQVKPGALSVEPDAIATGGYADIRRGILDGQIVAVKTLRFRERADANDIQKRFCKECIIWMTVSHTHLLRLMAVDIDPVSNRCSMISEMMSNGSIKEYIENNPGNAERFRLLVEAAVGLRYLHEHEIVHGDLKGDNILITNTPVRVRLADFGLSTLASSVLGKTSTITTGGTPLYMAPELLNPEKFGEKRARPTKSTDMYAFGMVVYEVLTGSNPFHDYDCGVIQLLVLISNGTRPKKPSNAEEIGFGSGTWKLVKECWRDKPTKRPTIERVLVHFAPLEQITLAEEQITLTEEQIILRWRFLTSQDPVSSNRQQIAALVDNAGNRKIVLKLTGEDAAVVINTLDKILKEDKVSHVIKSHAFKLMWKLAGASRQVPKSYLIGASSGFEVEETIIARGGLTKVRRGRYRGMDVAVNTLITWRQSDIEEMHEIFCKECVVWMNASHPNVLPLVAVEINLEARKFSTISEMMTNGSMVDYISKYEANRVRLLEDVARGLEYLHRSDIIHGDLNGANILITNDTPPRACISEFRLCYIVETPSFDPTRVYVAGGTPSFMAPELISLGAPVSKEADMYAFGIVIYEVIAGTHPYRSFGLIHAIRGIRPSRPEAPEPAGFGQGTWEFAERCWDKNPTQRPSAGAALEHFERVARTSTVVDPGIAIRIQEPANER